MAVPRSPNSETRFGSELRRKADRSGPLGHPAVLVLAGLCVLLGAYTLGYLPQFGSLLEDAVRSSRSSDIPTFSPAFYGIAGLAAFFILLGVLRSIDLLLRKLRDTTPLKTRPHKPVEQFIEEAAVAKICLRVAREGYYLLEPQYPHKMCIDLGDNLIDDLRLSEEAILALEALLFTRCDRRQAPLGPPAPSPSGLLTVFDLLQRADAAAPLRADRSGSRERATDVSEINLPPAKRQSDSAERKALHAATLQAIESGSLHAKGASGLHRRSSDYSGPRRRATDNHVSSEYKGPYERSTDHARTGFAERKTQPDSTSGPDRADVNGSSPLFVPPRSKAFPRADEQGSAHKVNRLGQAVRVEPGHLAPQRRDVPPATS